MTKVIFRNIRMSKIHKGILIVLLLVVYCFAFQGTRGLFEPDEGRYSAVALQMIKSGDWLYPRTHPEHEHWAKPPLTYWAIAGSILTFGKNEFSVRFPNAVAFFVSIIASFYFGKVFIPQRPWLISLIFGTFLFPAIVSNDATTDYLLTMWETLAVCFFANAYWGKKDNKQSILILLMWLSFGFAFLTKGPPGLLPLLSIIIFLQLKCVKERHFSMSWIRGFFIMLLVGGSWFFVVIYQRFELFRYFLWDEVILRLFTDQHQRHSSWYSFLYIYVPVLVLGTLPWSYYAVNGFIKSIRMAKKDLASDVDNDDTKSVFLIVWFSIPLTVFTISQSNLPLYVLPLFIPVAIMTAREIEQRKIFIYKIRYKIAIWCIMIILVRIFMGSFNFQRDSSRFAKELTRKYPHSVEEIVFVNTRPALGLQFYTGCDIERVSLELSDLKEELKEKESRLWLVLDNESDQFKKKIGMLNIKMNEIGPVRGWKNYVLFKEDTL